MKSRLNLVAAVSVLGLATLAGAFWWHAQSGERASLSEVSHIHGIAVDPQDPSRLYLATHHGVWHATLDGTAERISEDRNDYMGFTPHHAAPGSFLASGHPATGGNMGFIVSEDGARTWVQLSSGARGPVDFHAIAVSAADPDVIYGLYGDLQVSRDGGKTWEISGSPDADVFDIAASAVDPDLVYAATRDGLMASRDAGRSWQPTGPEGQPASMVETGPGGPVYAYVLGTGLMRAPAGALSWTAVGSDLGERLLLHLAIDPNDPQRMFAVTERSEILMTTDGGRGWTAVAG